VDLRSPGSQCHEKGDPGILRRQAGQNLFHRPGEKFNDEKESKLAEQCSKTRWKIDVKGKEKELKLKKKKILMTLNLLALTWLSIYGKPGNLSPLHPNSDI
jgi:hypothetical protein